MNEMMFALGDAAFESNSGDSLSRLRKSHGLTQSELAARIGVSKTTVWKWENHKARPNSTNAKRIEDALGAGSSKYFINSQIPIADSESSDSLNIDRFIECTKQRIAAHIGTSPSQIIIQINF